MRRLIAIIAALLLAGAGTFFLVRYVRGAEDRALAGEVVVEVLVADQPIEAGTPAEELTTMVRTERVPTKVAAAGAVGSLQVLAGKVAAVSLLPGEQLIGERFVGPEDFEQGLGPKVDVPEDLLQVTISLSPERAVGGQLAPGDLVAVFASFDPFALNSFEPTGTETSDIPVLVPEEEDEESSTARLQTPNSTKIILHFVLVTNLQAEELPRTVDEEEAAAGGPDLAPTGNLLVTLALNPVDAERLVFSTEHGSVWLAVEGAQADDADTPVQTRVTVYEAQ